MTKVAIAILNYNGENYLKQFLPTLIANSDGYPIYIGDNASTDQSIDFLKNNYPETICIELGENYGYSKGYNKLIKQIDAEYIVLVNSDIEVTNNWLSPLIDSLESDNKIVAVQPKIRSYANKEYFEYAGAAGGFIDRYGYPFCRGRLFDTLEKDKGQYNDSIEISWASGACFMVRKATFKEVGGFDDDFFAHMEEIDLCWRFVDKGYSIMYIPESIVFHVGGGTLDYSSPFKTYLNYRNGLYLLLKNLPKEQLQQTLVIRILLDWLSVCYNLAKGKWKLSKAILNAHREVLKNRTRFIEKRKNYSGSKKNRKAISIVWEYFFKGNKKYSDLSNTKQS